MVVLPYVPGFTDKKISQTLKQYSIASAMKPHTTLYSLLVHPLYITDAIYEIPCLNVKMSYVGETGKKFNTRLEEQKSVVEKVSGNITTRASMK